MFVFHLSADIHILALYAFFVLSVSLQTLEVRPWHGGNLPPMVQVS